MMSDLYGCGDGNCIYGHPGGLVTNGGCGCYADLCRAAGEDGRKAARQIWALRDERNALMAQRDALLEALNWYEEKARNCRKLTIDGDAARESLDKDGGSIAREAIARVRGGEG